MKTTEQIQAELDALQTELKTIESRSAEIDKLKKQLDSEHQQLTQRHREVKGYQDWRWYHSGLINGLKLELIESRCPVYKKVNGIIYRIISVDKKWIEIKEDGENIDESTKYNRDTGRKMRARDASYAIDAVEALAIWNEHLSKNEVKS